MKTRHIPFLFGAWAYFAVANGLQNDEIKELTERVQQLEKGK